MFLKHFGFFIIIFANLTTTYASKKCSQYLSQPDEISIPAHLFQLEGQFEILKTAYNLSRARYLSGDFPNSMGKYIEWQNYLTSINRQIIKLKDLINTGSAIPDDFETIMELIEMARENLTLLEVGEWPPQTKSSRRR